MPLGDPWVCIMADLFAFSDDFVFLVPPVFWASCFLSLLWMTRVHTTVHPHGFPSYLLEEEAGLLCGCQAEVLVGSTVCIREVVMVVPGSSNDWKRQSSCLRGRVTF